MAKVKVKTNVDKVKKDLKRWKKKAVDSFHKDLGVAVIKERERLQKKINVNIDRPTPFTQKAVNSTHYMKSGGTSNHNLFIMTNQEKYLRYYFEGGKVEKVVPVADDRTNRYGNIAGLAGGKKTKRFKTVRSKTGKILLIDPTVTAKTASKKKIGKRLVAIKSETDRKGIMGTYDQNKKEIIKTVQKRMKNHFMGKVKYV
ncbi:hypothetical protein MW391_000699 [Shigella sonnei]|nr:hypothetical protein [Escherichia coli]EIN4798198.1 hypothetical protein [Shigella sonnei]EIR2052324.1 hypothetical protein [Shigella sonnei]EJB4295339.1 hypothetical protein [Shigella sonnei]EJF5745464.1 hypothetical protein [Shigella sonnei]